MSLAQVEFIILWNLFCGKPLAWLDNQLIPNEAINWELWCFLAKRKPSKCSTNASGQAFFYTFSWGLISQYNQTHDKTYEGCTVFQNTLTSEKLSSGTICGLTYALCIQRCVLCHKDSRRPLAGNPSALLITSPALLHCSAAAVALLEAIYAIGRILHNLPCDEGRDCIPHHAGWCAQCAVQCTQGKQ